MRLLLVVMILVVGSTSAALVNFFDYTPEDYAATNGFSSPNWVVNNGGLSAGETGNSYNSVLYSPTNLLTIAKPTAIITGTVLPTTNVNTLTSNNEDDIFGFVLGFDPGDASSAAADYLLIDWKGNTQNVDFTGGIHDLTVSSTAFQGLALSRVSGRPTADELWGHDDQAGNPNGGVTELLRGSTLGASDYATGGSHEFRIEYSAALVQIFVDGNLEISLAGSFPNGRFGVYENHQNLGTSFTSFSITPVPEPTTWALTGILLIVGLCFCRRRTT